MARTKASVGAKVSSGKSSKARAVSAPPPLVTYSGSSGSKSSRGQSRGNPVCPRETPKWQKPITNFFSVETKNYEKIQVSQEVSEALAGTSKAKRKSKRNVIDSDNESETEPQNDSVLDLSVNLEPLNGESSHKIVEYYKDNESASKSNKDVNGIEGSMNGKDVGMNGNDVGMNGNNVDMNENDVSVNGNDESQENVDDVKEISKTSKGKGKGKKSSNKENVEVNGRKSLKRDLDSSFDEKQESKRLKAN